MTQQLSPTQRLVLAVYQKVNKLQIETVSYARAQVIFADMQNVTEMCDHEIESSEGLLQMGCSYVLSIDAYREYQAEQDREHREIYGDK